MVASSSRRVECVCEPRGEPLGVNTQPNSQAVEIRITVESRAFRTVASGLNVSELIVVRRDLDC